jgi:hypothetical protein
MKGLLAKKNVTVNELGGKDIMNGYDFFSIIPNFGFFAAFLFEECNASCSLATENG